MTDIAGAKAVVLRHFDCLDSAPEDGHCIRGPCVGSRLERLTLAVDDGCIRVVLRPEQVTGQGPGSQRPSS